MYSLEDRMAAVELYIKSNCSENEVILKLGYPSPNTLRSWYREYTETGTLHVKSREKPRYTQEQKQHAVDYYAKHPASFTHTCLALGYPTRDVLRMWIAEINPELLNDKRKHCKSSPSMIQFSMEEKLAIIEEWMVAGKPGYQVAAEHGISRASLHNWKRQVLGKDSSPIMEHKKEPQPSSQSTKDLEDEVARLRAEIHWLQMERDALLKASEILKKAEGITLKTLSNREKAEVIDALRMQYRLNELLELFDIAKSSYCYQVAVLRGGDKYASLREQIKQIFSSADKRYGYRRIHCELKKCRVTVSEKVVRRIMREENLVVPFAKMKKYSSYVGEVSPEVENLVKRNFHTDTPNKLWLTDITEFHIPAGKVYLSPMIDCFDGLPVAWTIGTSPSAELANNMLDAAISMLAEGEHPVVHTDRGGHYRWPGWIARMDNAKLVRSMSKKGFSPDNAACEGFHGRLKNEFFYNHDWRNVSIQEFIERLEEYLHWYCEKRIKLSLGGMSPMEYRKSLGLCG